MGYLVNLPLEGKAAVVVGAGAVASRKIQDLLAAGARVTVVAPRACEAVRGLAEAGRVAARWRGYLRGDLDGAFLAVAATGDEGVNAAVSADAQAAGILVNVVDRPALCTFTLPAAVRRGHLTIAVATDGLCPAFASVLRESLEERYGEEFAELTALFGALRAHMVAGGWSGPAIRETVAALYRSGIAEAIKAGHRPQLEDLAPAAPPGG